MLQEKKTLCFYYKFAHSFNIFFFKQHFKQHKKLISFYAQQRIFVVRRFFFINSHFKKSCSHTSLNLCVIIGNCATNPINVKLSSFVCLVFNCTFNSRYFDFYLFKICHTFTTLKSDHFLLLMLSRRTFKNNLLFYDIF